MTLSANRSWCLSASVTIWPRWSEENLMLSVLRPLRKTMENSGAPWPGAWLLLGKTDTRSEYAHRLVGSSEDGFSVCNPWGPRLKTRLYLPFQECFVTKKAREENTSSEPNGTELGSTGLVREDEPEDVILTRRCGGKSRIKFYRSFVSFWTSQNRKERKEKKVIFKAFLLWSEVNGWWWWQKGSSDWWAFGAGDAKKRRNFVCTGKAS